METRKFQLLSKGQIIGLVFISDNHPSFPNCKVGTILPIKKEGTWTNNDLSIIGQNTVTDIFELPISDEEVKLELASRVDFYPENISDSDFHSIKETPQ